MQDRGRRHQDVRIGKLYWSLAWGWPPIISWDGMQWL